MALPYCTRELEALRDNIHEICRQNVDCEECIIEKIIKTDCWRVIDELAVRRMKEHEDNTE